MLNFDLWYKTVGRGKTFRKISLKRQQPKQQ